MLPLLSYDQKKFWNLGSKTLTQTVWPVVWSMKQSVVSCLVTSVNVDFLLCPPNDIVSPIEQTVSRDVEFVAQVVILLEPPGVPTTLAHTV